MIKQAPPRMIEGHQRIGQHVQIASGSALADVSLPTSNFGSKKRITS
ncbi:MAG: hypothetical protein MZV65_47195 [Chromatiales bacterium]|nr:hypothetical protein [Chromatiales bacterium]